MPRTHGFATIFTALLDLLDDTANIVRLEILVTVTMCSRCRDHYMKYVRQLFGTVPIFIYTFRDDVMPNNRDHQVDGCTEAVGMGSPRKRRHQIPRHLDEPRHDRRHVQLPVLTAATRIFFAAGSVQANQAVLPVRVARGNPAPRAEVVAASF